MRELNRNPALLSLCGFDALGRQSVPAARLERAAGGLRWVDEPSSRRSGVPTPAAFSRFGSAVVALERITARIDDGFRFERHNIRGKDRMTARVALALAVMMVLALGSIRARAHDRMRSLVRPPPAQAA